MLPLKELLQGPKDAEQLNVAGRGTVHESLDIRITEANKKRVLAEMPVDERHIQFFGIMHGGVAVVLAESVASTLAWLGLDAEKYAAMGQDINHSHIRPANPGDTLFATATRLHQGRSSAVISVEILNQNSKLVSTGRYTIAIRPLQPI